MHDSLGKIDMLNIYLQMVIFSMLKYYIVQTRYLF